MPEQASGRYPVKSGYYSSHAQIPRLLGEGRGRSLLDVGCAQGEISAALQERGWDVVGVEPDAGDAAAARSRGVDVVEGVLADAIGSIHRRFDIALFADVLEHMADPVQALGEVRQLLAPGAVVVASIPNVAHLAVRLQLLLGSFDYTDRGPLDRTHLRFFTRRTVVELFEDADYDVIDVQVTPAPIEIAAHAVNMPAPPHSLQVLNWASAAVWPAGLAYQFLILARPRERS